MKAIKENWKLVLIVVAGIVGVIFMCIFGVQGAQNKAFALEEPKLLIIWKVIGRYGYSG